jgi:hypothetical protein
VNQPLTILSDNAHQYASDLFNSLGFKDVYFTGYCPVQGYGKTPCGLDFYFRSRGETATLEVYPVDADGTEGDSLVISSIQAFEPWEAGWIGGTANQLTQIAYVFYVLWQDIKQRIEE